MPFKFLPNEISRVLAVIFAVLILHFDHVPMWINGLAYLMLGIRLIYLIKNKPSPFNLWVLEGLAAIVIIILMLSFIEMGPLETFISILMVLVSVRIHQKMTVKNKFTLVFAIYFIITTEFLYSQEIWLMVYLIFCTILTTGVLVDANHPNSSLPFKENFKVAGSVVLTAIPLMLIFFVLFPRISTPLFGFMEPKKTLKSGISDTMTIGDIYDVAKSDEIAFRATFSGASPDKRNMYWRGVVLNNFDGHTWNKVPVPYTIGTPHTVSVIRAGQEYDYELVLEPQESRWLFSLDPPSEEKDIDNAHYDPELQLSSVTVLHKRILYHSKSFSKATIQEDLDDKEREFYLRYPKKLNPKSQDMVNVWLNTHLSQQDIIKQVLNMYHNGDYYYSLSSPQLGANAIDDFLFIAKNGFCEHYASTFAVLMRMANIPSRIVMGYSGGERNTVGNYYIIRQEDAHAWVELWINHQWIRVDPTSVIASDHVDLGNQNNNNLDELDGHNDKSFWKKFLTPAFDTVDWLNSNWNKWFLGYNTQKQKNFLNKFGLGDWKNMAFALVFALCISMFIFAYFFLRPDFKNRSSEKAVILWDKFLKKLKKKGIEQKIGEGALDFSERIVKTNPEIKEDFLKITFIYQKIRYANIENKIELEAEMKKLVKAFQVQKN